MRILLIALALAAAWPAVAQTPNADVVRVSRLLGANWRPLAAMPTGDPAPAFLAACEGAQEELDRLDASLPENLTPNALRLIRSQRGFIIVPTETPSEVYLFPNAQLDFIASGPGAFVIADAAQGLVTMRDSHGRDLQLQLGAIGGQGVMRVPNPEGGAAWLYVGCAASVG
jgi:hypothetical protein